MRQGHLWQGAGAVLRRRKTWIGLGVILAAASYWILSEGPDRQVADAALDDVRFTDLRPSPLPTLAVERHPRRLQTESSGRPNRLREPSAAARAVVLAVEPAERGESLDASRVEPAAWETFKRSPEPAWLTGEIEFIDD